MSHAGQAQGGEPPRGRAALWLAGLAVVWAAAFLAVGRRGHAGESVVALFWGGLGTGLLAVAGVALAVSGLRRGRERRGPLAAALVGNLAVLLGLGLLLLIVSG